MIRLFTSLCKSVLEKLSDKAIYQEVIGGFKYHNVQCPGCCAVGKLQSHGDYYRNFVFPDGEKIIESSLSPLRFKCVSCNTTHALLPDIIVPYSPYSLRCMLTVLVAYFERTVTVAAVCANYGIAVSTLYEWKNRLLEHKDLLLGMLQSKKEPVQAFLQSLFASTQLSEQLSNFFCRYAFSFLQGRTKATTRSHPP